MRTIGNTYSLCVWEVGGKTLVSLNAEKSGTYCYHFAFDGKCCDVNYASLPFKKVAIQGSVFRCGQCTMMIYGDDQMGLNKLHFELC